MDKNDNETAKEKIDEIWLFVEKALNTTVPTYIKNILKICGYNNGISIASIEEEDFTYFEAEVRNGNVGNYFVGSKQGNFLEGCAKTAKDFEFIRGHKKFILFIVDFLKNHLEENGMDSFSLNGKLSKKPVKNATQKTGPKLVSTSRKRKILELHPLIEFAIATKLENYENSSSVPEEILIEHRKVLLKKTIASLIRLTPNKLEKDIESIKKKVSGNFITLELKTDDASVLCVYCQVPILVFLRPTTNNAFLWKTSNFDRHLAKYHQETNSVSNTNNELSQKTEKLNNPNVSKSDEEEPEINDEKDSKPEDSPIEAPPKIEDEKSVEKLPSWCQQVPILKNGYKSRCGKQFITTRNTCAFDSIFITFTCFYFDNLYVRDQINSRQSKISELIKSLFSCASKPLEKSSERALDLQQIYINRNTILNELYSNWCKEKINEDNNLTNIDCKTGIGGLFARMCLKFDSNFASAIEERTCNKCKTIQSKILPFLTTTGNIKNLAKMDDYIDFSFSHKSCLVCKNNCDMKKYYNNVVVLEVEPRNHNQRNKKIAIKNVCPRLHINNIQYVLCAVMHYDYTLEHFSAYVRRLDNNWKCYDDTKKTEKDTDASTEINPFMLCYISMKRQIDFENLSFFSENKIKSSAKNSTCAEIHSGTKLGSQLETDQTSDSKRLAKKRKRNSSKYRKKLKLGSDTMQNKKPWRN